MAKLYFYYSAMNAGKSTVLLQSNYNYHERGMKTVLFTAAIDTRYVSGKIQSRIGLSSDAVTFDSQTNIYEHVGSVKSNDKSLKCVLVDEAQFLTKGQVLQLASIVDQLEIPVLAYGLRTDFQGMPFEGSLYLLALADNLVEIKTICHCGRKATMNMRIDEKNRAVKTGAQIEIGGNERYIAVCRKHFSEGKAG